MVPPMSGSRQEGPGVAPDRWLRRGLEFSLDAAIG
jgi:hypothetical protein